MRDVAGPHSLPTPRTPLVGRRRELADLRDRLLNPDVRLLTLTGPGGTGKTRLALAVAAELQVAAAPEVFRDGIWLVDLALIHDDALVVPAIAQALGVKEQPREPLLATITKALHDQQALLVLDNFEQVVAAAPDVATLLDACPDLKLLVTSRTALRVYGEHQYQVPPLAVQEAETLFRQRAHAAYTNFVPTDDDSSAISEICARLDGLPLAIELAAARVRLLSPNALLARLNRGLSLLSSSVQNVPQRQQTLRRTIDWSYDLLSAAEQTTFRRIAAFAGGCTLEAAEAVCGESVVETIASLVDKSLLERRDGLDGEPRFAMLEIVREYALERLEQSEEADRVRDAHAQFFLRLAELAEPELTRAQQTNWYARLDADRENLRAALEWSLGARPTEAGVRLATALWRYWDSRGDLAEGQRWLDTAVAADVSLEQSARARVLNAAGLVTRRRGEMDRSAALIEESLAIRRAQGHLSGQAAALVNLGNIAFDLANYERAAQLFDEGLQLYRTDGNREGLAIALNNVAITLRELSQVEQAVALHEEALALRRELGDPGGIAQGVENLGRAALEQGDHRRAAALLGEGLSRWRELRDRAPIPLALEDIGRAAAMNGELARAARIWGAAEAMRTRFGTPMPLHRKARYTAAVDDVRARLGAGFADAWTAGAELSTDAAIDEALSANEPTTEPAARSSAAHPLTRREQEIAELIARGLTSKEIAAQLVVSEKTVDTHADHIRQKLGLRSRLEIATWVSARATSDRP